MLLFMTVVLLLVLKYSTVLYLKLVLLLTDLKLHVLPSLLQLLLELLLGEQQLL